MIRGTTLFMCDECGKMFRAADIEYGATIYSVPQPCPKCGSKHTMPIGPSHLLGKFKPSACPTSASGEKPTTAVNNNVIIVSF